MSLKSIFAASDSKASSGSGLSSVFAAAPTQKDISIANQTSQADASRAASDEANSASGLFKNTVSGIWDTVKGFGSGLISAYTNPDEYTKSIEASAPPILRQITMPIVRTFAPITEQLNKDIVSSIILNQPQLYNAFVENLATQKNPTPGQKDAQNAIIDAPTRTPLQIVGDVSQAVLGAYSPEILGEGAGSGLLAAAARNAEVGLTFGLSQAASSGSTDPKELAKIALQGAVGGALIGLATEAVHRGVAKSIPDALAKVPDKTALLNSAPAADALDHITEQPASARFKQTHEEYAQSQGYEPYTAHEDLPTIDMGPKAKDTLPTIKADTPAARKIKGDLTYEPITDELKPLADKAKKATSAKAFVDSVTPEEKTTIKSRAKITGTDAPKVVLQKENAELVKLYRQTHEPIATGSEGTISGLAKHVSDQALKEGFDNSIGKLPEYGVVNMEHQRNMARDLIARNPDLAMQVARGEVASPVPNLLPESVYSAFRVLAKETADREIASKIYHQLSEHSPTTAAARAMGQRIKALDSGIRNDPLDIINEVKEAREKNIEAKTKGTTVAAKKKIAEDIKTAIKKNAPSRQSWEEFIQEVQCKY